MERFHRQLKATLQAKANPLWNEVLSLAVLSPQRSVKEKMRTIPNQLVFGCSG